MGMKKGVAKWGNGWCDVDPNELVFTFGGSYVCASFGEIKKCDRDSEHGRIHIYTNRRKRVFTALHQTRSSD